MYKQGLTQKEKIKSIIKIKLKPNYNWIPVQIKAFRILLIYNQTGDISPLTIVKSV